MTLKLLQLMFCIVLDSVAVLWLLILAVLSSSMPYVQLVLLQNEKPFSDCVSEVMVIVLQSWWFNLLPWDSV